MGMQISTIYAKVRPKSAKIGENRRSSGASSSKVNKGRNKGVRPGVLRPKRQVIFRYNSII